MTNGNPNARQVIFALTLSGALVLAANGLAAVNDQNGKHIENPLPKLGGIDAFFAWGVLLVFLIAMAEFEATGALGASFAWLILIAVLFVYGIPAFNNLRVLMNVVRPEQLDAAANPRKGESIRGPR